jgi:carboxyl-terminal processing protease
MRRSWLLVLPTIVFALAIGLAAGIIIDRRLIAPAAAQDLPPVAQGAPPAAQNAPATPGELPADFELVNEAWNQIQKHYVDREAIQARPLAYGAVSGMVDALGDTGHSVFLSPDMLKELHTQNEGQYEGIGALMEMKDGHPTVVAPFDGSPAQKAGLRAGDIILQVDGQSVEGLTLGEVSSRIVGPAGAQVTLTIQRPSTGETMEMTIPRAKIVVHNVTWRQIPGTTIAHLRLAAFSQGVSADLERALAEIRKANMTGIILDLRNNPGGLVEEAIGVGSQLLPGGNLMLVKDASGQTTEVPLRKSGRAVDLPVVVLVNQGTASASEIVSGAIQDAKRGQVVGETTFGTGTVLQEFPLSDGSAVMLAVEEWLTPAGRVIWHQGITPDITVPLPANIAPLLPESEAGMTEAQIQASGDAQLLRALQLLQSGK